MTNISKLAGKRIGAIAMMLMVVMAFGLRSIVKAANFDDLHAYGVDTIAGYSTVLSTSKTYPNRDVLFRVTKPDGGQVQVAAVTNDDGIAKVDLYDYHTRKAGKYGLTVSFKESTSTSSPSSFLVYPDEVSDNSSAVVAQKTIARADGTDPVYVTVSLLDQYGNAFPGHTVNVVSSRVHDSIRSQNGSITDAQGNVTFLVTSSESGVSVFSAVDTTSGVVLQSRTQVAFLKADAYVSNAGGYFDGLIPVAAAQPSGPLHHFEISDIPASIQPNQNVSFRVTAQDQNDLTVENYTGTIHFSAEGDGGSNVELPEDYTFKAEDLGTHQFSLGLKFVAAGTYTVIATDISNTVIKGEKTVTVGGSGTQTQQSGTLNPVIASPQSGTTSQNVQTITGTGTAGMTAKIFDNDQEIGLVQVGTNGSFSYQTSPLSDGEHQIYVALIDSSNTVQGTSDTVTLTVDTTAPAVDEIQITPSSGITPGQVLNVKVLTEENLTEAALIFNQDIIELSPSLDQPGAYIASLSAPQTPGEYTADVVLVDELGNEATYQAVATVSVSTEGGTVTQQTEQTQETQSTQESQVTEETQVSDNLPPSQVFGVLAYGSDKRVTLVWEAATDDSQVAHYRVYYGLDPANLDQQVDTFDAATTWYVPNLTNGKEYFFALVAVDDGGAESLTRSELVSGIPFTLEVQSQIPNQPQQPLSTAGEEPFLRGAAIEGRVPPEMSQEGPELIWLLFGTGAVSTLAGRFSKKKRK